jgi:2-oxoisovalerate dehydrogenase E1 component
MISEEEIRRFRLEIKQEIEEHLALADEDHHVASSIAAEETDVFAPHASEGASMPGTTMEMRFVDAISDGLDLAMQRHSNLILMGQDIAEYGGVFKITQGFAEKYGIERVRNTPICESAIVGTAVGLSIEGYKSMVEMQFADFVTCGFNQIVNNVAKLHYRWNQNVDIVIRMPTGAGVGAGPFHSQSNEGWFFHIPGLKIVYPSTPEDAKGLLLAAFEDPNPVMFFEHKALYRKLAGQVPEGYYTTSIGKAKIVREGKDATVITYGMGVIWATDLAEREGYSLEILDLRTLSPLDYEAIDVAAKKTNRVLVLHEANMTGGIGAEIAAYINENLFDHLDAPVMRAASLDTPVPFAAHLEQQFLPTNRIKTQVENLINY